MTGEDLATAAQALVGVPFRLHGRDRARGVDCVGLLAAAIDGCGRPAQFPNLYRLHNRSLPDLAPIATANGLLPAQLPIAVGDVALVRVGPCQVHIVIAAHSAGFVHAHAGLGRVVVTPPPLEWPVLQLWRVGAS